MQTFFCSFNLPSKTYFSGRVKGTGISFGMTDGTSNIALSGQETTGLTRLNGLTSGYGNPVGTPPSGSATKRVSLGVTTDAGKSGIICEADANIVLVIKF